LPVEETVPLLAALLSLPLPEERYPPRYLTPQRQRQKTLDTLVAMLLEWAARHPVLFIVEDLHWTDPSTLELLDILVNRMPTTSLYALFTCRPAFHAPWGHYSYFTQVTLQRLAHQDVAQMITNVTGGKTLPGEVLQQIVDKTDGVPLFVEEMTKAVVESGVLKEINEQYELVGAVASLAIPTTLQDSLMARLDRLSTAKAIAQCASVLGRHFSYAVLRAVSPLDDETLQRELERLVAAELVCQRGDIPQATYLFKHALVRDIAYASLLRRTRQHYHAQIADVLAAQFPATAAQQPELLAHHYTEAGLHAQAVAYWHQAGQEAVKRFAHREAVNHLQRGLEVLQTLPDTSERHQHELDLLTDLGSMLTATQGYGAPEVEHVYTRARELCRQVGNTPRLFAVLQGLGAFYQQRGALHTAQELAEQLLDLARRAQSPPLLLRAYQMQGSTVFYRGELVLARRLLEEALVVHGSHQHRSRGFRSGLNTGVICLGHLVWTLWFLGYPTQALTQSQATLALASAPFHPHSLAYAQHFTCAVHQFRREVPPTQEYAEAVLTLATEYELAFWRAYAMIMRGWASAVQGQGEAGGTLIQQGLDAIQAIGGELGRTYFLALLTEGYRHAAQVDKGLCTLAEALALVDKTGERFYAAELHRLKGELLLCQSSDNQSEAETCFHHALDIARTQHAKSLELRTVTSLARLWHQQGKRQEAYDLLASVYGWFTEGFDTADLQEAKALLDDLEDGR
jgi:predicted ATPase